MLLCRQGRGLRRRRGYLPLIRHRGWWRCLGEVITCSGSRPYALVHRHEYSPCTCKIAFSSPQTKGLKPRATLQGTSRRESNGYLTRKSSKPSARERSVLFLTQTRVWDPGDHPPPKSGRAPAGVPPTNRSLLALRPPGGRWGSAVFGWRALHPPGVVFVLGFVSLINSLTWGKTLQAKPYNRALW